MDERFTEDAAYHRRASRPYRLIEAVGLVAVLYGLASSEWLIAIGGAVVIFVTYSLYRRRHGRISGQAPGSMGMGEGD
jgi:hypothetical protein